MPPRKRTQKRTKPDEVWTTEQVADYCNIKPSGVSNKMNRLDVPVHDREPGRGGRNRYLAHLVREKVDAAPGKGNRTPRKAEPQRDTKG